MTVLELKRQIENFPDDAIVTIRNPIAPTVFDEVTPRVIDAVKMGGGRYAANAFSRRIEKGENVRVVVFD